jgi:alkylation response protein AidB-like acyl-CoA dehydrogenase
MNRTHEHLLADIQRLAPRIAARAAEIETGRRTPPDLVDSLKSIGVFRMFAPRSVGGMQLDLAQGLEIISALSRIDGSVGWNAMIGSVAGLFLPLLPRETYERIYRDGPDVIAAGSIQPAGTAEATPGGWRVSGRWPFASGCQQAGWILGFCVVTKGGKPLPGPGGEPALIRGVLLPADQWQIEDSWYAAGLRGTGSHHVRLTDRIVPAANFFDFPGTSCVPGPLYQSLQHFLPLLHGASDVGMAEGTLDDLIQLANTGRQQFRAPSAMRESETFQYELGRVAADVRAARAYHAAQTASHWRHALAGTLKDEPLLMQAMQMGSWIATTCVRVADACFTLAGGSAVYDSSPLQRRLRDLHTAAQHAMVHQRHYANVGKQLLSTAASDSGERLLSMAV